MHFDARLIVLPALEQVMYGWVRIGLHERRDFLGGFRAVLFAFGNGLLHTVAQRGVFRKPLRQVVVADIDGLGVCFQKCLHCRLALVFRDLDRLQDAFANGRVQALETFV